MRRRSPRDREPIHNICKYLNARGRDYEEEGDEIYADLSGSMSRGTDGLDGVSTRHDIMTQFLFDGVTLKIKPELDRRRNFSHEEKLILYRKAGGCCQLEYNGAFCGHLVDFEYSVVDHIKPHSKGGRTEIDNGRIAYEPCNRVRGDRSDFDPKIACALLYERNAT